MYIKITDTLFENIRLDILNWTNHEMQVQNKGTINEYLKTLDEILVFVKELPPYSDKPYYTFKHNNTYFTVYVVKLGETFVQMNVCSNETIIVV